MHKADLRGEVSPFSAVVDYVLSLGQEVARRLRDFLEEAGRRGCTRGFKVRRLEIKGRPP